MAVVEETALGASAQLQLARSLARLTSLTTPLPHPTHRASALAPSPKPCSQVPPEGSPQGRHLAAAPGFSTALVDVRQRTSPCPLSLQFLSVQTMPLSHCLEVVTLIDDKTRWRALCLLNCSTSFLWYPKQDFRVVCMCVCVCTYLTC